MKKTQANAYRPTLHSLHAAEVYKKFIRAIQQISSTTSPRKEEVPEIVEKLESPKRPLNACEKQNESKAKKRNSQQQTVYEHPARQGFFQEPFFKNFQPWYPGYNNHNECVSVS